MDVRPAVGFGGSLPTVVPVPAGSMGGHAPAGLYGLPGRAGQALAEAEGQGLVGAITITNVVMPGATAWDRRENETPAQYARFVAYRESPRSERAKYLKAAGGTIRDFARRNEWFVRVAAYDDQADRDYEQARTEHVREVRGFHARSGRALLAFAIDKINTMPADAWRPGDLIKLADLGRKMEMAAVLGSEQDMTAASHSAMAAAGADVDEWDRLAADLAGTIPGR